MKAVDKIFVVTGGGNGIGREVTLLLLEKGAQVAAVDISEQGLEETKSLAGDVGNRLSLHVVNITDRTAVEALPDKVKSYHGSIDGLINVAGIIQPFVKVNDLDYDAIERVMNVNFYGTLYMVKTFLPGLLERPEAHIVNVSSMGGFFPFPGQSIYGASKAAIKIMTEGLWAELANTNVHVTVIFPGSVATNISENSGVSGPEVSEEEAANMKAITPSKAAQIIVKGMEKNKTRVYPGSDSRMMNILYRIRPNFAVNMIRKKMEPFFKDA